MISFLVFPFVCLFYEIVQVKSKYQVEKNKDSSLDRYPVDQHTSSKEPPSDKITRLELSDLEDPSTFLVYIYYDKANFNCSNCKYFKSYISKINIPVKSVNFAEDIRLASRFLQYKFPSFVIRDKLASYHIIPDNGEDLLDIVNNFKETSDRRKLVKFKPYLEITSPLTVALTVMNFYIFKIINIIYYCMDHTPSGFINLLMIFTIVYLVYSIVEIFQTPAPEINPMEKNK